MRNYKWTTSRLNIFKIGLNKTASRKELQVQAPYTNIGYVDYKKILQVFESILERRNYLENEDNDAGGLLLI